MSLTILDPNAMQALLTRMWQKQLGTDEDPANGRWYTNGANDDNVGLYGGLTDTMDGNATLDEASKHYAPTQVVAAYSTVDNRNGLVGPTSVTLSYQYTNSVTTTHTVSNAVKVGFGYDFKAKAEIFGIGGESTTKFSIDYTYTSSDANSNTQTQTQTFSQTVAVNVPAGKVYKAVLVGSAQRLDIPYHLDVSVTGTTETWFEDRINGHYNWMMDIGSAFGLAGDPAYKNAGGGRGVVVGVTGMLTAQQTTDFTVQIWDVTNQAPPNVAMMRAAVPHGEDVLPAGAVLVSSFPATA